jgi:hypothetical protein
VRRPSFSRTYQNGGRIEREPLYSSFYSFVRASSFSTAASASCISWPRQCASGMASTSLRLWPANVAICGTVPPAMASRTTAVPLRLWNVWSSMPARSDSLPHDEPNPSAVHGRPRGLVGITGPGAPQHLGGSASTTPSPIGSMTHARQARRRAGHHLRIGGRGRHQGLSHDISAWRRTRHLRRAQHLGLRVRRTRIARHHLQEPVANRVCLAWPSELKGFENWAIQALSLPLLLGIYLCSRV